MGCCCCEFELTKHFVTPILTISYGGGSIIYVKFFQPSPFFPTCFFFVAIELWTLPILNSPTLYINTVYIKFSLWCMLWFYKCYLHLFYSCSFLSFRFYFLSTLPLSPLHLIQHFTLPHSHQPNFGICSFVHITTLIYRISYCHTSLSNCSEGWLYQIYTLPTHRCTYSFPTSTWI